MVKKLFKLNAPPGAFFFTNQGLLTLIIYTGTSVAYKVLESIDELHIKEKENEKVIDYYLPFHPNDYFK
jgi:hypothetical protein